MSLSPLPRDEALVTLNQHFAITPVGLIVSGAPSFDSWQQVGLTLQALAQSAQWCWGDWLIDGERRYGEMYSQALDATTYTYQGLADIVWVCHCWPFDRRLAALSFEHHRVCAPMPDALQDAFMSLALAHGLSANRLRRAVRDFMEGVPWDDLLDEDPLVIDTTTVSARPRLICASAATIARMTDEEITLKIHRLPAAALRPGVEVYLTMATIPPESIIDP